MESSSQRPVCTITFPLNNGTSIPAIGLGTWQGDTSSSNENEGLRSSIVHALRAGYRLIDTAQYYGVESVVGTAIHESGVPRSEITVITKFWGNWHHDPATALQNSLKDLRLDYIDIFMMHWPAAMTPEAQPLEYPGQPPYWETWKMMEKLVGRSCRGIGVSNFTQKTLNILLEHATIVPVVNEVELHALNPNLRLVPYCLEKGIRVISWSTMGGERFETGQNPILHDEPFTLIARKHSCSAGLVSLSWAVQRGVVCIPKSNKMHRIDENIRLVNLDEDDMEALKGAHVTFGKIRLSDSNPGMRTTLSNGKTGVLGWSQVDFGWEDENGEWLC